MSTGTVYGGVRLSEANEGMAIRDRGRGTKIARAGAGATRQGPGKITRSDSVIPTFPNPPILSYDLAGRPLQTFNVQTGRRYHCRTYDTAFLSFTSFSHITSLRSTRLFRFDLFDTDLSASLSRQTLSRRARSTPANITSATQG
jgi:hypothetical protein